MKLCNILVSESELNSHRAVFQYIEHLTKINLLTTFPVLTLTNLHRPSMRQSKKAKAILVAPKRLYDFPRYIKYTQKKSVVLSIEQ